MTTHSLRLCCAACRTLGRYIDHCRPSKLEFHFVRAVFFDGPTGRIQHFFYIIIYVTWMGIVCVFFSENSKDRVLGFKAIYILNSCMMLHVYREPRHTYIPLLPGAFFMFQTSTLDISVDTRGESSPHELLTKLWQFAMRCRNFGHGVGVEVPFNKLTMSHPKP